VGILRERRAYNDDNNKLLARTNVPPPPPGRRPLGRPPLLLQGDAGVYSVGFVFFQLSVFSIQPSGDACLVLWVDASVVYSSAAGAGVRGIGKVKAESGKRKAESESESESGGRASLRSFPTPNSFLPHFRRNFAKHGWFELTEKFHHIIPPPLTSHHSPFIIHGAIVPLESPYHTYHITTLPSSAAVDAGRPIHVPSSPTLQPTIPLPRTTKEEARSKKQEHGV
jgi:hypothetical protein